MSDVSYLHIATNLSGLFGVFVIIGGVIGYLQAESTMSLVGGLGAGLVALAAHLLCRRRYYDLGLKLLTGVSLALIVLFFKRFRATGTFFPAGFMAINSATVLFVAARASKQLAGLAEASKNKSK